MYKNTGHWIQTLESRGELVRIREYVNPHLEISEITDRISKKYGPALLFENTGTEFPLLINSMGTEKRMALLINSHQREFSRPGKNTKMAFSMACSPISMKTGQKN